MRSNEEIMVDAIKKNTTQTLARFMRSGNQNYKFAIAYFGQTQTVELRREEFGVVINGYKFYITYKFVYLKEILKALSKSIEEIMITKCPSDSCLDSVIFHIIHNASKLRQITFLDDLPEKHEAWIGRHSDAKLVFPVIHLSEHVKSSSNKTLVLHPVAFSALLVPFKDLASYQSIKALQIHGTFKEENLRAANCQIQKFIQFVNSFPSLTTIEAFFNLIIINPESYTGYAFYEIMKKANAKLFNGFSSKLRGKIHFGSSINRFENMDDSIKNDLYWSGLLDPPIKFDGQNSVIRRKFQISDHLKVEMSLFAIFSDLK